ncbi:MAG: hypothetical protein II008_17120 [Oscillospiraceae bacterium]|nr:hypothetical protein [Oscillospiraceae bacterium]
MDRIELNGTSYRVEVNWNAIVAFLEASGRDDVRALVDLTSLKPSDLAGLLAAAVNEGERLDGHDVHLSGEDVGAMAGLDTMAKFIEIFGRQTKPKGQGDPGKKE